MELTMEDTTSAIYWEAHYQKLGDTSWTDIGDFKTSSTTTAYLPVDGSSKKPTSTMMRFKFVGITNDTTKTPKLLGYDVRAILYPTVRTIIACTVRCAYEVTNKQGLVEKAYEDTKTAIENGRDATWPVTIYDIDGATKNVKFLPLPGNIPRWNLIKDERGRVQERHYNLLLQEVQLS